jgi:dolichyl-phosphate beta-glucosyltransferase
VSNSPYLSLILPAYNEAAAIRRTLTSVRSFLDAQNYAYEVIVAADGDDATPQIVADMARTWANLELSAVRGRHGKGQGVRRGLRLATGDIIGFMDADYKTPIEEIDKVLPWLSKGYQLVAGSRGVVGTQVRRKQPWYRQLGSRLFGFAMHTIVGLNHIRDTQCGFKFFTRAAAEGIFGRARIDGYMCDVEILWLAERLGYRVREVGIVWSDDGDSRLELMRGNLRNGLDLFRIRFGRYAMATTTRRELPVASPIAGSKTDF